MPLFSIEHSKAAYFADFALYLAAVLLLPIVLLRFAPAPAHMGMALAMLAGLAAWSLAEYATHRLVLHGMQPFRRLHAEHHRRPGALIATPTALSVALIVTLVWLPLTLAAGLWLGSGATLGVTAGYLVYGVLHHALHHWRLPGAWLRRCQRRHALHHRFPNTHYGVTMAWWDQVFRTERTLPP
jgi:cyclopropane-fatty-acyl-phospholipid synthase